MIKETIKTKKESPAREARTDQLWADRSYRPYGEYTGPKAPRISRAVDVDRFELPQMYDNTRLTLLARDPHWIHAYWELSSQSVDEMRRRLGAAFDAAKYVLRMHDVTQVEFNGQNSNQSFDIEVAPQTKNWYMNLWCDNVAYCSQLGVQTPDGQFHPLAQSNTVNTPRSSYSDRSDLIWMDVKDNKALPFIFSVSRRRRIEKALSDARIPLRFKDNGARKVYLTEDDVRAYYSGLFPLLGRIRRRKKVEKAEKEEVQRLKKLQSKAKIDDALFPGMSKSEYFKKFLSGASAELAQKGGASETLSSGASERHQPQRKFFFELGTELIVYGRTEPDAEVRHGDKVVPLRKDGTFTLRFALPDGNIPLDFIATSQDKVDYRRITTSVERFRTMYSP